MINILKTSFLTPRILLATFIALGFFSYTLIANAGTWGAPVNDPSIPPPNYVCGANGMWNPSPVAIGSACAPDGSTYRSAPVGFVECVPGEWEPTQNPTQVVIQTCNPSANTPPTANAGSDRTITQPTSTSAPLGASASDVGGSVASTIWSVVSGSPTPTIVNGSTLTPTFNGMTSAGSYTFRLRVTDNLGLFTDDTMTVTVNVANPQCSDGIDNDGDTRIDSGDWGCHSDNNATNAASYVSSDNDETNAYCAVPGWGPEVLVFDGWAGDGPGWCNGTAFGACPGNLGGGPTSLSAKGSPYACCRGFDNLGWVRQCLGSPAVPVAGDCGTAQGTTVSSEPAGTAACSAGTYTNSPADTGTNWNWTCSGTNGGANASCTASKPVAGSCAPTVSGSDISCSACSQPGDEVYWTISGTNIGMCPGNTYPAALQEGTKCTYGSTFEPDYRGPGCDCTLYEYAAAPSSCTAPVNGSCGPGAGTITWVEPTGASACSAGSYTNSPSDTGNSWNWTCSGLSGGTSASCSAWKDTVTGPSTPAPACVYGESASTMTYSRAADGTNSYDDNLWGIWSPTCAADVWDRPFMNDAADFARANSVPESDVQAMQFSYLTYNFDDWFPQGGGPEQISNGTGALSSMTWGLYQENGSTGDLIPCYAAITVNICNPPPNYTLTTAISPGGSGTVTASGINCPGDCTESYVINTMVTAIATPLAGYAFSNWSGVCAGQPSSCSLQMDSNKNTTANFVLSPSFDYTISNSGPSNVTKQAGDAYTSNAITRTLVSGITEATTITATGMPSGVSVGYDALRTCSPSPVCVSTITFTVNNSTAAGTYLITVTSTAADGTPGPKVTTFNLVVTAPAGLSVTCSANPTSALLGEEVTWSAVVSGGTAPFTYSWSGTDIPTSPAPTTNPYVKSYSTIGQKTANVTVTDAGSFSAVCNPAAVTQINFDPSFEEF